MLRVTCEKCDREGSYRVNGLIGTRGDGKIIDWLDELTADCPKKSAHSMNDHAVRRVLICRRCCNLPKLEPRISGFAATPVVLRLRPVLPASACELQASAFDELHASVFDE
jgi:hypothetical protein